MEKIIIENISEINDRELAISKAQELYLFIQKRVTREGGKVYESLLEEYNFLKNLKDKFQLTDKEISKEEPEWVNSTFELFKGIITHKNTSMSKDHL